MVAASDSFQCPISMTRKRTLRHPPDKRVPPLSFLTVHSRKSITLFGGKDSRMARQKEFDRDEVLHKAMEVFWSRGYEASSIQDLVKRMGINRQSLYDTFGDKHTLYLQALDRYREVEGRKIVELLEQPG